MADRWPGVWGAVHDERTCPTCRAMAGQALWSDAPFAPPAHDRCRCVLLRLPLELDRLTARQRIELGAALAAGVAMAERLGRLGPAGAGGGRARRRGLARSAGSSLGRSFVATPGGALAIAPALQGGSDAAGSWLQRLSDAAFAAFNEAGGVVFGGFGDDRSTGSGGFR